MRKSAHYFYALLAFALLALTACNPRIKEEKDWQEVLEKYQVNGCFEIVDNNKEQVKFVNPNMGNQRFSPMENFDIFLSCVALETATAPDETYNFTIDSAKGTKQNLAQAFKNYNHDFFIFINKKNGQKATQHYLDTIKYGNATMGKSDQYWLDNTLKVTIDEQIGFLSKLYHNELGFSDRTDRIVMEMMQQEKQEDYTVYYRYGISPASNKGNLVTMVGIVESIHRLKNPKTKLIESIPHPYFFALSFYDKETANKSKEKAVAILHELLTLDDIHKY